jgi:hypothetical protein
LVEQLFAPPAAPSFYLRYTHLDSIGMINHGGTEDTEKK